MHRNKSTNMFVNTFSDFVFSKKLIKYTCKHISYLQICIHLSEYIFKNH